MTLSSRMDSYLCQRIWNIPGAQSGNSSQFSIEFIIEIR